MGFDSNNQRFCDNCGRAIEKADRVYKGNDYCATCYASTFVTAHCSLCQRSMRVHRNDKKPPVCLTCQRLSRTCVRCDKPVPGKVGVRTPTGVACPSCAPYFREPKPCSSCGEMSTRLSRSLFSGLIDPVCPKCRTKPTHATCHRCHRYRQIEGWNEQGKPFCKSCVPGRAVSHACPSCGDSVPGGGRAQCYACGNDARSTSQARLLAAALIHLWLRELWMRFARYVISEQRSNPNLSRLIDRSFPFFAALDGHFEKQGDITSERLTRKFRSADLRRHLLASRWLVAELALKDVEEKRSAVEAARQRDAIVERLQSAPFSELIGNYAAYLSAAQVAPRTARLYLRAAEAACQASGRRDGEAWHTVDLVPCLKATPGQAASLSRFAGFLRESMGWDVNMPSKKLWQPDADALAKREVSRLKGYLDAVKGKEPSEMSAREVVRILSATLGIPIAALNRFAKEHSIRKISDQGIQVFIDVVVTKNDVGGMLYPLAQRWQVLRGFDGQIG